MKEKSGFRFSVLVFVALILASISMSCKPSREEDPYLVINVYIDPLNPVPVDKDHRLYARFYITGIGGTWVQPILVIPGIGKQIVTPRFGIHDFPLFMEIVWDYNGNHTIDAGDWFHGLYNVTNTGNDLYPILIPETEVMILYINLEDYHGTY
jgi:hypothetical protein